MPDVAVRLHISVVISLVVVTASVTYWITREMSMREYDFRIVALEVEKLRVEVSQMRVELVERTQERWTLTDHIVWVSKFAESNPALAIPPVAPRNMIPHNP